MSENGMTKLVAIEYAICAIDGQVLELIRMIQPTGIDGAARSCLTLNKVRRALKRVLKRHGRVEKIVTDGLRSYPAAMHDLGNLERRELGLYLNNRAENSHLPFRRRERAMLRFRQMRSLQKFASVHASIANHFNLERHLVDRQTYRDRRSAAMAEWQNLIA